MAVPPPPICASMVGRTAGPSVWAARPAVAPYNDTNSDWRASNRLTRRGRCAHATRSTIDRQRNRWNCPQTKNGVEIFRCGVMSCMATMTEPVTMPANEPPILPGRDEFFPRLLPTALTYDDVSLATLYSEILPKDADLSANLSETLRLQIPIISSDMDTVTGSQMAIAMSLNGGMA